MSKKKNSSKQNPYHVDKFATIPAWFKIEFLKFWLAGATFYLVFFGLPQQFDYLDRLVMSALVLTIGLEYLVQNIIRWMHTDKEPTTFYLIHDIKKQSVFSLLATLLYASIITIIFHLSLTTWLSLGLMTIGTLISESTLDPFSFAIVFLVVDTAWMFARKTYLQKMNQQKKASDSDENS